MRVYTLLHASGRSYAVCVRIRAYVRAKRFPRFPEGKIFEMDPLRDAAQCSLAFLNPLVCHAMRADDRRAVRRRVASRRVGYEVNPSGIASTSRVGYRLVPLNTAVS